MQPPEPPLEDPPPELLLELVDPPPDELLELLDPVGPGVGPGNHPPFTQCPPPIATNGSGVVQPPVVPPDDDPPLELELDEPELDVEPPDDDEEDDPPAGPPPVDVVEMIWS